MIVKRSIPRPVRTTSTSLWLKLLGLFVIAFALAFMLFFAYDLFSSFAARSADTAATTQAPPIAVDPKIESDLAKVLAFDSSPEPQAVKDPFNDRGGLSGEVSTATSSGPRTPAATAGNTVAGSKPNASGGSRSSLTRGANSSALSAVEATKRRYETWLSQVSIDSDKPLDPRIFSVEDLWPVGIVDGGSGQQEVMFFSEAINKTISFPIGTLFYDGWLSEVRPEGVVFNFNDDRRTIRMRSWTRSLQTSGQNKPNG